MEANNAIGRAVFGGFKKLAVLHLEGMPPLDAIRSTAEVWMEAILFMEAEWPKDMPSALDAAFARLCRTCTRWPAPADLLAILSEQARQAP